MKNRNDARHKFAEVARRQSSPYAGKPSARPAGQPGDFFIVKGEFATIPSSPLLSAPAKNTGRPVCVFEACRNLSGPMWFPNKRRKPNLGWGRAASRWSAPSPGRRTCREDHAPSHRPQMSSDRLFLDRVARQHCPSPLHRQLHPKTVPGWGTMKWQRTVNSVLTVCLSRGDNRNRGWRHY